MPVNLGEVEAGGSEIQDQSLTEFEASMGCMTLHLQNNINSDKRERQKKAVLSPHHPVTWHTSFGDCSPEGKVSVVPLKDKSEAGSPPGLKQDINQMTQQMP